MEEIYCYHSGDDFPLTAPEQSRRGGKASKWVRGSFQGRGHEGPSRRREADVTQAKAAKVTRARVGQEVS